MQPFFTYKKTSTLGGQVAPKKGGQLYRNFHVDKIFHFANIKKPNKYLLG